MSAEPEPKPVPAWVERYREAAQQDLAYSLIRAAGIQWTIADQQFLARIRVKT